VSGYSILYNVLMLFYNISSPFSFHAVTGVGSFHTITAGSTSFFEINSENVDWSLILCFNQASGHYCMKLSKDA